MQEGARVVHVVLTRFNCRFANWDYPARTQPGWLESRFDLFERYCLPTLKAQSVQDFEWAVYFDRETPRPFVDRIHSLFAEHPNFHARFIEVYSGEVLAADLSSLLAGRCDWLVTTRLDNDDGLSRFFVETLQADVQAGRREVLNFPLGLVFSGDRIYLSRQSSNAFLSVSEPFSGFQTALHAAHKDMGKHFAVRDITADAMWLQVLHDSNVSNKRRGRRILSRAIPPGFDTLDELDAVANSDSAVAALVENMTFSVAWSARDTALHLYRQMRGRAS